MPVKKIDDYSNYKIPLTNEQKYLLQLSLTDKQERFAQEYVVDLIGSHAAIRAGYAPKHADVQAAQLKAETNVALMIDQLIWERAERTRWSADKVLTELAKLAFVNVQDLYDENGKLKPINEIKRVDSAAIESIVQKISTTSFGDSGQTETETTTIKLASKKSVLELFMRHLGLLNDKLDITSGNLSFFDLMVLRGKVPVEKNEKNA